VVVEAVGRLRQPQPVEVAPMLAVAVAGLVANVVAWLLLRGGARESLTLEGASAEVLADVAGSLGAIGAGVTVAVTGWTQADAVFGGLIGLFILPRGWRLGGKALRVLMQAAPRHLDIPEVRQALVGLPGVVDVHDLHIWTLTSDMEVVSAHVMIRSDRDPHATLDQARALLVERFGISHATLQVEPETHEGCQEVRW
jgi:cobalt-zinc-cadmium efflux system protein